MKLRCGVLRVTATFALPLICLNGQASEHGYIGARAGWVYSHDACEEQALSCSDGAAGGGLYAGYQVSGWLALELGYDDLGNITADYPALEQPDVVAHYTSEMQGFEIVAKPFWQLNANIALFAKAGTFAWRVNVTGDELTFEHKASDNGWSVLLGAGADYAFNRNWSAQLEYQWIDNVGGSVTGGTDVSMASLGVTYHFRSRPAASVTLAPPPEPAALRAPTWSFKRTFMKP